MTEALRQVDVSLWSARLLGAAIDELGELVVADEWVNARERLEVAAARSARARLEQRRTELTVAEAQHEAQVIASRPDFSKLEALFKVSLPSQLKTAWASAYEGDNWLGFILVGKSSLEDVRTLANALVDDLPDDLAREPRQLLPFADDGDGRFVALDLARPRSSDFPCL